MRYDEFFRMAQGEYVPVKLSRRERWRQKRFLKFVSNELKDTVSDAGEDVWSTSCAKELRKYADGRTYVRFECRMLKPDCTFEDPLQVMILIGARRELLGVTTVYGTGRPETDENGEPVETPALTEATLFGFEPAGDWNPTAKTRTIHVARGLRRALMHARRMIDVQLEQTLLDNGIDEKEGVPTLDVDVPAGTWDEMMLALDEEWSRLAGVWSKDDRRKLCLYLAIQGVGGACRDIAFDYDKEARGRDGEKNPKYDFERMLYWFEQGAKAGDAQSQYNAGYLYRNAEKTQHDCDRAVYWFEKAAAQDHVDGLKALAYCLECGRCVPTDRKRVEELKKRAAELEKEGKTE